MTDCTIRYQIGDQSESVMCGSLVRNTDQEKIVHMRHNPFVRAIKVYTDDWVGKVLPRVDNVDEWADIYGIKTWKYPHESHLVFPDKCDGSANSTLELRGEKIMTLGLVNEDQISIEINGTEIRFYYDGSHWLVDGIDGTLNCSTDFLHPDPLGYSRQTLYLGSDYPIGEIRQNDGFAHISR